MSNYAGIDYSGPGSTTNRDPETGIRYGVISQHSIQSDVMSDIWSEARDLSREAAVEEMKDSIVSAIEQGETAREALAGVLDDFVRNADLSDCIDQMLDMMKDNDGKTPHRDMLWDVVEQDFNDRYEDNGDRSWLWEKDGYALSNCLQSDVFVSKSPYFTYAPYCSPCCPGAGNLDSASAKSGMFAHEEIGNIQGCKAFCLGHSFFENEEAPYPVFSVATGKRVVMVEKKEECQTCNGATFDSWIRQHSNEVEREYQLLHGEYGDAMNLLSEFKEQRYRERPKCWRCGGLGYEVKKQQEEK